MVPSQLLPLLLLETLERHLKALGEDPISFDSALCSAWTPGDPVMFWLHMNGGDFIWGNWEGGFWAVNTGQAGCPDGTQRASGEPGHQG